MRNINPELIGETIQAIQEPESGEGCARIINVQEKSKIEIDECTVCNYVGAISHNDDGQECCPNCRAVNQFRKTDLKRLTNI